MKKIYLSLVSLIAGSSLFAQIKVDPNLVTVKAEPVKIEQSGVLHETEAKPGTLMSRANQQRDAVDRRSINFTYVRVGGTRYDLQSNASIGRRILLHSDGTVSTVFTTSTDNQFLNRGTGYNYFDGSSWINPGDIVTPRIEDSRTGWPSIGIINGSQEAVIGHIAETGGFVFSTNNQIGSNTFSNQKNILEEGTDRPIWGRMATDNDKHIHIIANYSDSLSAGQSRAPVINGVTAPTVYARSVDAGETWDVFGRIINPGSNFTDGDYQDIPALNSGQTQGVTVNFSVVDGAITSFSHNGNRSTDFEKGDELTLLGRISNLDASTTAGSPTITLSSAQAGLIPGSSVTSANLPVDAIIVQVLDSVTIEVSLPATETITEPITITPPYGNGRFFVFRFLSNFTTLPEMDSARWTSGAADRYAIDVKDSIVAIVTGGLTTDVVMWKSTDHGETFTIHYVDSFPYAPFEGNVYAPDTPFCSDGTHSVVIDHNGKVHVWYGLSRILNEDTFSTGFNFYPTTVGLVYWNDDEQETRVIANQSMFDRDEDGILTLRPGTWNVLNDGQIPSGLNSVARLTNTSLLRQPSGGVNEQNQLFVTFSVPIEGAVDFNDVNYRDIYIMHSTDNGVTWEGPQNVTQKVNRESDFASIARDVNDFVHILLQEDDIPGVNLTHNVPTINNHPIPEEGNDMLYAAIPVEEILDGSIGNLFGLNVKDVNHPSKVFVVSQNSPNPFHNQTDVTIYLSKHTPHMNLQVRDITGKIVFAEDFKNVQPGNHVISIDGSQLSGGVYFYTLTAGVNTVTKKMIVNK